MKIRMITFHTPKNYGAVLQSYSLMKYFEKNYGDVRIIDYNTKHLREIYPLFPKIKSLRVLISNFLILPYFFAKKRKFKKFDQFVKDNLSLTKRYETLEELAKENWDKDVIFTTGSDQVFNPNRIEEERKVFYLDFTPSNNLKFSYAASIGVNSIEESKKEEISNYLKSFYSISVREKTAKKLLEELTGKNVYIVLDPVFLTKKKDWQKIQKPYKKSFNNYLLYYRLLCSRESDALAMKIARQHNFKLLVVGEGRSKKLKYDYFLRDVGPEELLYLYDNASFIVSDSFHGVAFSIVYNKQFIFSDYNNITNERGKNLLKMLGINCSDEYIDYEQVNINLQKLQISSYDFIKNTISEILNKKNENR